MTTEIMQAEGNPDPARGSRRPSFEISRNNTQGKTIQVLVFLLGEEQYAVDLFDVREVVGYTPVTQVPNAASCMKGIIDLRGEITTIIDVRERLHIEGKADQPMENCRIIVLDEKTTKAKTGILVDDVLSVSTFEQSQVDSASDFVEREDSAVTGIIRYSVKLKEKEKTDLIILLDIIRLLPTGITAVGEC